MPLLPCLTCGAPSEASYCARHRTRQSRGYGDGHFAVKARLLQTAPWCARCGTTEGPFELDHTPSLKYIRKHPGTQITYRLLCRPCHNAKKQQGQGNW